jgi:hypothetical protein
LKSRIKSSASQCNLFLITEFIPVETWVPN